MKIYLLLILSIFLMFSESCGTLGGFTSINFSANKEQLSSAIDSIYKNYPNYNIPDKWKKFDDWSERGYDFLDSRIFYFKDSPEEMYYVTFLGNSKTSNSGPASLAIRAVCNGQGQWRKQDDFSEKEIERIESRFEVEILSKLKYTYYKTE